MSVRTRPTSRALLRAALAVSTACAALGAGAGAAAAHGLPTGLSDVVGGTITGLDNGVGPVKHLRLDPLARTGVDPLTNGLGAQIADFKPLSTTAVTKPITDGASLSTLPLIGPATGLLPG